MKIFIKKIIYNLLESYNASLIRFIILTPSLYSSDASSGNGAEFDSLHEVITSKNDNPPSELPFNI